MTLKETDCIFGEEWRYFVAFCFSGRGMEEFPNEFCIEGVKTST